MRCHVCNVAVGDGQRFCHECGEKLDGVTDPTEAHDVVPGAGATLLVDDDITIERDAEAETAPSDGETLHDSESVTPPTQPEPEPEPDVAHRGALPDLAAPPMSEDNDASWWAAGGGSPEPVDDLPSTELFDVVGASLPPTEAVDVTPATPATTGNSLDSVPDATKGDAEARDPVAAFEATTALPAGAAPVDPAHVATDEFAPSANRDIESTSQMIATEPGGLYDGDSDARELTPSSEGFRLRSAFVFGVLAMVATLMSSVADVIDIRTTRPVDGIIVGIRDLDDFGTNLAVAGFVGAALMLVGGLLSCFGLRWGAGIAGGAGLSMTGWAAVTLGLVEAPIHAAEGVTLNATGVAAFTLSVTRDLGYFLVLAIGVLGVVVFLVSLRMAGTGGRGGLNPWVAALGALAAVVVAAGPLITLGGLPLDANLSSANLPDEFHIGRLVQLGLIVVTGVLGFLSVRTYGLGLALGGLGVATWMWVTSLAGLGDDPKSPAVGNLTLDDVSETTPHAVTTVGITASLAFLLIAATTATVTRRRT